MRSDWEERQAPALLTPPGLRTPPPPPPMSSPVLTLVLVRRASSTRRMPQLEWVLPRGLARREPLGRREVERLARGAGERTNP